MNHNLFGELQIYLKKLNLPPTYNYKKKLHVLGYKQELEY